MDGLECQIDHGEKQPHRQIDDGGAQQSARVGPGAGLGQRQSSGGEGQWPIYDRAVDAINLLQPDFVITVGDMIPGHMEDRPSWDAEWAEVMAHAKRLEAPLFLTPGNHDLAKQYWQQALEIALSCYSLAGVPGANNRKRRYIPASAYSSKMGRMIASSWLSA